MTAMDAVDTVGTQQDGAQRTHGVSGRIEVVFSLREGPPRPLPQTVAMVSAAGPLELRRPVAADDRWFLRNVTAGVFGGDSYNVALTCEAGASARVEPTSATKVYGMPDAGAVSRVRLRAEDGSRLVWGPQTTILHGDSDYMSEIEVVLAGGTIVVAETVVMGRLAAGESFAFRRYVPSLVVRDETGRALFTERASLTPSRTLRDAMAGRGALSSVYALGVAVTDSMADRLTRVTQEHDLSGWSVLPNGAGVVVKALVGNGSQGEAFAGACIRAMR